MRNPGRLNVTLGSVLSLALLLAQAPAALAQNKHTLPLFVSASHQTLQGFARIINLSDRDGEVTIHAFDDTGKRFGPATLSLEARKTRHFNSDDLRDGNTEKGFSGRIGSGQGNKWRLELETDLEIDPLIYTRPRGEGFVTSTHDVVAEGDSMRWRVSFFNPGTNTAQQSWLRVVNTSGIDTEITVEGLDDNGAAGTGMVRFDLAANAARMLSARELEQGSEDPTFEGQLGNGSGKWQLFVSADQPIQVMSLLLSNSGYLTNLSTSTIGGDGSSPAPGFAPTDQPAFDARFVGKRMRFSGDLEYADFVSVGRLVDTDDGGSSLFPGSYTYRNARPDSGVLYLYFDAGVSCPAQIMFDSASSGTITHSCGESPQKTETWQLVEIPAAGFAPEDQAAFDARFVGKRMRFSGDLEYADFVSVGRLVDTDDGGSSLFPGSYTYRNARPDSGVLYLYFDVGVSCPAQIMFDSASSGTITHSCGESPQKTETWQLVEIPAAGFAPEDQAAFDARFVGKRWLITLALNSEESLVVVWYFISSGRFEEYEDGERTERGPYEYQNTGLNTGNIRFRNVHSDGLGPLYTWNVTFDSATAGTISIVVDGSSLPGSWRVADDAGA